MPTLKQKVAAQKTFENLGKSKAKILKEAGYSETVANNPQIVTESAGYKEATKPFIEQMEAERQRLIDSMTAKSLDSVTYRDHISSLDILTKNIQLLSGKSTEKIELNTTRVEEIEKALDDM